MKGFQLFVLEVFLYIWLLIGVNLYLPEASTAKMHSASFAMLVAINILAISTAVAELAGLHKFIGNVIYYGGAILVLKFFLFG